MRQFYHTDPRRIRSGVNEDEIIQLIERLDDALAVFQRHGAGLLTAKQVGVKSMLMALRAQMVNERRRVHEGLPHDK